LKVDGITVDRALNILEMKDGTIRYLLGEKEKLETQLRRIEHGLKLVSELEKQTQLYLFLKSREREFTLVLQQRGTFTSNGFELRTPPR
jgi:hypothetical protein